MSATRATVSYKKLFRECSNELEEAYTRIGELAQERDRWKAETEWYKSRYLELATAAPYDTTLLERVVKLREELKDWRVYGKKFKELFKQAMDRADRLSKDKDGAA